MDDHIVLASGLLKAARALDRHEVEIGDSRSLEIVSDVLSRDATTIVPGMPMIVRVPGREPGRARVGHVKPSAFTKVSPLGVEEQCAVDAGRARLRPVVIACRGVRDVQIESGLSAGDRVIVYRDERL